MKRNLWRTFGLMMVLLSHGCASGSLKSASGSLKTSASQPTLPEEGAAPAASIKSSPSAEPLPAGERLVAELLAQAEQALASGRLTSPSHDNAYDRFRAIQLLRPDNAAASAGLHAVLLAYVDLVRQALRNNRLAEAETLLARAEQFFPGAQLLSALEPDIEEAKRRAEREAERLLRDPESDVTLFQLPAGPLSQKDESIGEFLAKIADRIRQSDEAVLIMARSDAEGRWIYRQLNEAAGTYRVRGDIRIDKTPAIRLLPPID